MTDFPNVSVQVEVFGMQFNVSDALLVKFLQIMDVSVQMELSLMDPNVPAFRLQDASLLQTQTGMEKNVSASLDSVIPTIDASVKESS